jgi:hypothetical protein
MSVAAVNFLEKYGSSSLVSLGCGDLVNHIDNHVRLFIECGLEHYVGIDRVARIRCDPETAFVKKNTITSLLSSYYNEKSDVFFSKVRTFPETYVEELEDIRCAVVVCQRVLPFRHWEKIIESMRPILILQEDLRGCEKQTISSEHYKKTIPSIIHYQLQPFQVDTLFPGERNLILWRRRDFFPCAQEMKSWWKRTVYCLANFAGSLKQA